MELCDFFGGNRLAQHNYPLCLELTELSLAIFLSEGFIPCCISECSQTPTHQQRALSPNLGAAPWKPKGVLPSTLMKVEQALYLQLKASRLEL